MSMDGFNGMKIVLELQKGFEGRIKLKMIACSDSADTSNFRHYHVVWYWDDATYDGGTASTGLCEPLTSPTTYVTYTYYNKIKEKDEFLITAKEINRIRCQKILGKKIVNIPTLNFKPKRIRRNDRMMFCQRR